jgi:hypothetical protein
MSDESNIISLLMALAYSLPIILVCIGSLIAVTLRVLPKKTKLMATIGLSLLSLDAIAGAGFRVYIASRAYQNAGYDGFFSMIEKTYSLATTVMYLAGIIFLVLAICVKDAAATEKKPEQAPYQ